MTIKKILHLKEEIITELNKVLSLDKGSADYADDSLISRFTVALGEGFEVDIKVVNGDESAGPYVDAVLFQHGQEIYCLEPSFETIEGEFNFEIGEQDFSIEVIKEL